MAYSSVQIEIAAAVQTADGTTVLEYLRLLLRELWNDPEGFSGKRPFGDSGWQYEIYAVLIKAGCVTGKLDEDGYVQELDEKEADALVKEIIHRLHL